MIAIANQKGGVGKSTTAVSLGAALADLGYRVLVADLDPQGNASTGMGIRHEARERTVYDVVVAGAPITEAIIATPVERLFAVPSTIDLAGAEIELVSQFSREGRLKSALEPVREGSYDFIFLDCPPSLGLLTINAMTAAEELIVPIQCEYYALEGLGQLLRNVSLVQQNINPGLRLTGIVMTMFDSRTKLSEQVVAEVKRFFGDLVYDVIIPRTVRLSEAPGFGQPITVYDPKSKGAESYRELAKEVALRPPPAEPMREFPEMPAVVMAPMGDTVTQNPSSSAETEETPTVRSVVERTRPADRDAVEEPPLTDQADEEPDDAIDDEDQVVYQEIDPAADTSVGALQGSAPDEEAPGGPTESDALDGGQPEEDEELWEERAGPVASEARVSAPHDPVAPGHLPERRVVVIDDEFSGDIASNAERPTQTGTEGVDANGPAQSEIGRTLEHDPGRKRRWSLFRKGGE